MAGVLRLEGEVDMASAEKLQKALSETLAFGGQVIIDLSDVTFMDCSGLHCLLDAVRSSDGHHPLVLRHPSRSVRRVLDIAYPDGIPGILFER